MLVFSFAHHFDLIQVFFVLFVELDCFLGVGFDLSVSGVLDVQRQVLFK